MPYRLSLEHYQTIRIQYFHEYALAWCSMCSGDRQAFTTQMLSELRTFQCSAKKIASKSKNSQLSYIVLSSNTKGIFNFGGDLELFCRLILSKDRQGLIQYATTCIDILWDNITNLELPITTISLVQGNALGGGFEGALSSEVIIAEKGAKFGFPEISFNIFPGMGAYHILSEHIGPAMAKKMMLSGEIYSAEYLYDLGLVDSLVSPGEGERAVIDYVKKHSRMRNGYVGVQQLRNRVRNFTYDDLIDAASIWVDTALNITERDIRRMQRLASAQKRSRAPSDANLAIACNR